ncbi:hypothetical protein MmiHf6_14960 [Methanimicrococcus hongohii]|uniref:Uncharacterized protein n=1 Tax=Methanimicrococcus hongohii TaxID=3028295 RepID=A0AA96VC33_9EURY|nr:hypothetical protein [Methanimicrococcus sp. Hf6]WNY24167.1 hypothetical protein MmiHf6_14960 [Methanimicrococcus sp. Hf6]
MFYSMSLKLVPAVILLFAAVILMISLKNLNKKNQAALFIALFCIFLISLLLNEIIVFSLIAIFIFYFGSFIYGFISKNPVKSYLLGLSVYLTWFVFEIFTYYSRTDLFEFDIYLKYLIYSVIWGLPGFLTAQDRSVKWKYSIFIVLALIIIFIEVVLFYSTW